MLAATSVEGNWLVSMGSVQRCVDTGCHQSLHLPLPYTHTLYLTPAGGDVPQCSCQDPGRPCDAQEAKERAG